MIVSAAVEATMEFWIVVGVIVLALTARAWWRRRHPRGSGLGNDYASERAGRAQIGRDGGRGFFAGS